MGKHNALAYNPPTPRIFIHCQPTYTEQICTACCVYILKNKVPRTVLSSQQDPGSVLNPYTNPPNPKPLNRSDCTPLTSTIPSPFFSPLLPDRKEERSSEANTTQWVNEDWGLNPKLYSVPQVFSVSPLAPKQSSNRTCTECSPACSYKPTNPIPLQMTGQDFHNTSKWLNSPCSLTTTNSHCSGEQNPAPTTSPGRNSY